MFLLLAVATFLICSVLLTLPKAKGCSGCLFDLLRFVALVVGALASLIILFGSGQGLSVLFEGGSTGSTILRIASIFLTIVFGSCALALVAHAWQMLMERKHNIDDDTDLSEFDPPIFCLRDHPVRSIPMISAAVCLPLRSRFWLRSSGSELNCRD